MDTASSQTLKLLPDNNPPDRTMKHIVQVYNQDGKVRIKFMDSNNDVIYQTPTEIAIKIEDQMTKSETSANIKV